MRGWYRTHRQDRRDRRYSRKKAGQAGQDSPGPQKVACTRLFYLDKSNHACPTCPAWWFNYRCESLHTLLVCLIVCESVQTAY
jgi:hypothetical protein